ARSGCERTCPRPATATCPPGTPMLGSRPEACQSARIASNTERFPWESKQDARGVPAPPSRPHRGAHHRRRVLTWRLRLPFWRARQERVRSLTVAVRKAGAGSRGGRASPEGDQLDWQRGGTEAPTGVVVLPARLSFPAGQPTPGGREQGSAFAGARLVV